MPTSTTQNPGRVGLFGGTFDPVHLGHLLIAESAREALGLDQVRFLPCRISPHKSGGGPTSGRARVEMLQIATRDRPWAVIDDFDLSSPPPSYSYRTAGEMRRRFPDSRLFWILGRDQWDALPRWTEPERLAELLEFIVFPRDGRPAPRSGWRMHVVEATHPTSATEVREAVRHGAPIADKVPPGVADYIRDHGLYKD